MPALTPATLKAREEVLLPSPPRKRGSRGTAGNLGVLDSRFRVAFAGMTGEADHRGLEALAGAEEVDRPLFTPRGEFCGKSRARSAAARIKAPPLVDVLLLVEGLAQAGD
jgi:hypothetical protein